MRLEKLAWRGETQIFVRRFANEEFEKARRKFGKKADDFISKCYALHEAFALSLRPAKSSDAIKDRLMAMVKAKKQS